MAATRLNRLRTLAAVVALAVLGWIAYETVHAGGDIPPANSSGPTRLTTGAANGRRIDGRSWSLDYASAIMSTDGSSAEIEDVHDGVINRNGKPFMHMRAKHVSANMNLSDFRVVGPVSFVQVAGAHRSLETIDAHYEGLSQILTLNHRTTIREGPAVITVDAATVNFRTGETKLGRIAGTL